MKSILRNDLVLLVLTAISLFICYDFILVWSGKNEFITDIAFPIVFFLEIFVLLLFLIFLLYRIHLWIKTQRWIKFVLALVLLGLIYVLAHVLLAKYSKESRLLAFAQIEQVIKAKQMPAEIQSHISGDKVNVQLFSTVYLHKRYEFILKQENGKTIPVTLYNDVEPVEIQTHDTNKSMVMARKPVLEKVINLR